MLSAPAPVEKPRAACLDDDQVERLALGLVTPLEEDGFDDHLDRCPSCNARHDAYFAQLVETLRHSGPPDTIPDDQQLSVLLPKLESLLGTVTYVQKPRSVPVPHGVRECLAELGLELSPNAEPRIGKFHVLAVLGQGGMGMVFNGRDEKLHREVAIKVMKPEVACVPAYRERFAREARAAGQLQHDNIVPIFEVDEFRGVPYIAMPLMKGKSLHDLLRERKLDYRTSIRILAQTARGLAFAHARGMIHRDIKPANLWIETHEEGNRVRILDFGLVHAATSDPTANPLTHTGAMMGTPGYMSPEQSRGEVIDGRADLFSLGCVMYEMLTRHPAFTGNSYLDIALKVATEEPSAPRELCPDVPESLSLLTMRLLRKRPEDRVGSAKELLDEYKAALQIPKAESSVKVELPSKLELKPASKVEGAPQPERPPVASVAPIGKPSRRPFPLMFVLTVCGFVLLLLTGMTVYRISTDKGELVIESDDPDVKLKIEKNGELVEIVDAKSGTMVRLRSGEYEIKAQGNAEVTLTPGKVRISRDGVERVTVTRSGTPNPLPETGSSTKPPLPTKRILWTLPKPREGETEEQKQVRMFVEEPERVMWRLKGNSGSFLSLPKSGEPKQEQTVTDGVTLFFEKTADSNFRIRAWNHPRYLKIDKAGKVSGEDEPSEDGVFTFAQSETRFAVKSVAHGWYLRMAPESKVTAAKEVYPSSLLSVESPPSGRLSPPMPDELKLLRLLVRSTHDKSGKEERVTEVEFMPSPQSPLTHKVRFSVTNHGELLWWGHPYGTAGEPQRSGEMPFETHSGSVPWLVVAPDEGRFKLQVKRDAGPAWDQESVGLVTAERKKIWVRLDPDQSPEPKGKPFPEAIREVKPEPKLTPEPVIDPATKEESAAQREQKAQARLMMNEPDDFVWEFKGKHARYLAMMPTGELYAASEKNEKDERFLVESTRFGHARLRHAVHGRYLRIDKDGKVASVEKPTAECEVIIHKRDAYSIGIESVAHRLVVSMDRNHRIFAAKSDSSEVGDPRENMKFEVSSVKKVPNPVAKRLRMLVRDADKVENEREATELEFQYHHNGSSRRFSVGIDGRISIWDPSVPSPPEVRATIDFVDHDRAPLALSLIRNDPDQPFRFRTVMLGWVKLEPESIRLLTPQGKKIWVRLDPKP